MFYKTNDLFHINKQPWRTRYQPSSRCLYLPFLKLLLVRLSTLLDNSYRYKILSNSWFSLLGCTFFDGWLIEFLILVKDLIFIVLVENPVGFVDFGFFGSWNLGVQIKDWIFMCVNWNPFLYELFLIVLVFRVCGILDCVCVYVYVKWFSCYVHWRFTVSLLKSFKGDFLDEYRRIRFKLILILVLHESRSLFFVVLLIVFLIYV